MSLVTMSVIIVVTDHIVAVTIDNCCNYSPMTTILVCSSRYSSMVCWRFISECFVWATMSFFRVSFRRAIAKPGAFYFLAALTAAARSDKAWRPLNEVRLGMVACASLRCLPRGLETRGSTQEVVISSFTVALLLRWTAKVTNSWYRPSLRPCFLFLCQIHVVLSILYCVVWLGMVGYKT